ncbi:MAG TPA: GIY-YIG nuclease family protein [Terricaulis sp.]|nr:GIY-YIG nuclease family protein [Terricaulis sp.]HRP11722.1 GIY-YIG nuclease family protein [Terricaulis sp.]
MRVDESRLTATYMMASRKHGTLYLGSALDLIVRVSEHKEGIGSAFVRKYGVTRLVWYQPFMLVSEAREREYEMKKWRRDWKTKSDRARQPRLERPLSGAHRRRAALI